MIELAPNQVIIVKLRTEKEMRVSFRKILLGKSTRTARSCPSICLLFIYFFFFGISLFFAGQKGFECTLTVRACVRNCV